jgi:hypothetical protein
MCGGIRFAYSADHDAAIADIFGDAQCVEARRSGMVTSTFWGRRPALPVIDEAGWHIIDWGNRDAAISLPRTGWMRNESLLAGRWDHLSPRPVCIPALAGVEKGVWFAIDHGIHGYVARRGSLTRVYMLTCAADPAFARLTGHDRMPVLIDQAHVVPLAAPR